jgi:flagellar motor switch protein FliN
MLAEISNIVVGNLKSSLNDAGYPCAISTPSLTYGADFSIKSFNMEGFERLAFSCQEEMIFVEVGLKTQQISGDGDDFSATDSLGTLKPVDFEKVNALDCKARVSEAVIDVFDSVLSTRLEPTDTIPADSLESHRNVGSISFAGDAIGMVSIHVGDNFSRELAAGMLGKEVEEIKGEAAIKDMMGELANIVGGDLKSAFTDAGLSCALSSPTFTTGTDFTIESLNTEKYERFAFRSGTNSVFVEMGVKISDLVQDAAQQGKDIHDSAGDEEAVAGHLSQDEIAAVPPDAHEAGQNAGESVAESAPEMESTDKETEKQTSESQHSPVQQAAAQSTEKSEITSPGDFDLDLLLDIPLEIKVELGRTRIQIQELLNLSPGSALKLVKLEGEPVDILANDTLIARGEVVVQNEKYGIRVTEITSRIQRIRSFSI